MTAARSDADPVGTLLMLHDRPLVPGEASFSLVMIEGPDRGRTFVIDDSLPSRTLIGQSEACDIRLSDRHVSRRHAALEVAGRRLRVTDLGSTNGTFLDGVQVEDAYCVDGSVVRLGTTAFCVQRRTEGPLIPLPAATSFGRTVGASAPMRRLYPLCERLAISNVPVVIEGETGTGKEVLAESLHEMGPRSHGPFVVFDCTAVPPNLMEAELFGHERGAFTGAVGQRKGVFEQAHGGTLLIDEIGDLDTLLQPKLLRAIERSEVRRIGGDRPIRVDVRLLSATRRDLDHEVQVGRFRDDLFHRLAVARIELPPLRKRKGDVPVLVQAICAQLQGDPRAIGRELLQRWEDDPWPGNVRELRNAVARQLALGDLADSEAGEAAAPSDEPPAAAAPSRTDAAAREDRPSPEDVIEKVLALRWPLTRARQQVIEAFERRYIERVLAEHEGNVVRAAAASGIARRYFQILKARKGK